jgi:geranylgeranyl reductase family protein
VTNVHYAFAIVGAGPAGTTCANALLMGGAASSVLIDKAHFPRDKPCGDGLGPGVTSIFDELGLQDILSSHLRVMQMSITGPFGGRLLFDATELRRPSPLGYVIPRRVFDHVLLTAALDRGCADMTGWSLENAALIDRRWQLTLAHSETSESRLVTADVLIGADGAASKVRRVLGQRFNRTKNSAIALRMYAKAKPDSSARQRQDNVKGLPPPGYGWAFSTGKEVVNVGVVVDLTAYRSQTLHLKQIFAIYQASLPDSFAYEVQSGRSSILPLASEMPQLAFPAAHAALIGDAASMINSLTGEGIFYGMCAGLRLGKKLAAEAKHSGNFSTALAAYEREFRRSFTAHFRGNSYLRNVLRIPRLSERMIAACAKDCDLCCDFIEYMMGNVSGVSAKPLHRLALKTVLA